jgi:hypothetical protein
LRGAKPQKVPPSPDLEAAGVCCEGFAGEGTFEFGSGGSSYRDEMKFGWLHDGKNRQKWEWCRERTDLGRIVGLNWYSTDSVVPPRDELHKARAANFTEAVRRAQRILADAGVIAEGRHYTAPLRGSRQRWTQDAIESLRALGCNAVLLDPDTGISRGKPSNEHVTAEEVAAHAEAFAEIAVFQHTWQRVSIAQQKQELAAILNPLLPPDREAEFRRVEDQHFLIVIS